MAKTTWNAAIANANDLGRDEERHLQEQAWSFLALSRGVLTIFGPEGDEDGPLQEIESLQSLLHEHGITFEAP